MKNKLLKAVICAVSAFTLLIGALQVFAVENTRTVGEAQNFIDGIVAYKFEAEEASSVQQWIEGALTENVGSSSEWYIIALSQYGSYDFSSYRSALLKYLSENKVASASSRQKYALAIIASGGEDEYVRTALNDSIGKQGVMSWIFGMHLLNNGYLSDEYFVSDVKKNLLSLQLSDGGWAVTGANGDVDATAMAVQALAPYYANDTDVKTSVDRALELLSLRQKDTGDYASYGVNNPESTAQVLVALSSLGIDCTTDSRFIKNGNTLFDAIELYKLPDGSFSHTRGGSSSETATAQVFCSMVSYIRMQDGKTGLYLLDATEQSEPNAPDDISSREPVTGSTAPSVNGGADSKQGGNVSYKLWVSLAIIIAAGGVCAVMLLMKKRNIKNLIAVIIFALIALTAVIVTDFQTTDSHYGNAASKDNAVGTVTLTIRCDTVPDKSAEHIPDDGVILGVTEFELEDGDTVYDILLEATAKNRIHLETNGSNEAMYVEGIGNIYEFDFGDLSGWVYHVNGGASSISCGEYKLSAGDEIEWLYTCALGNDLE